MRDVLHSLKPTKKEEIVIKKYIKEVLNTIKIKDAQAVVGGSFAKKTWLRGNCDIDIFVQFDYKKYKDKSRQISDILEKSLKKLYPERLHGSRDYFRVKRGAYIFEIVPILKITKAEQAVNITDVSPLHTQWVKKHHNEDEIRLSKAFARAQDVYGAESYLHGFSGYVLEVLTIHYGSFLKFMKAASQWKQQTIIDSERLLHNPLLELNNAKIQSPLILVDPVDRMRNAAAALSREKYHLFIQKCKAYLKKPNQRSFLVKKKIIPKGAIAFAFPLSKKKSVAGTYFSLFNKLKRQLILEGFVLKKSDFVVEDSLILWFLFQREQLSEFIERRGPPVSAKEHVKRFRKKHREVYVKRGVLYAREKRTYVSARTFLEHLLKTYGFSPRYI